MTGVPESRAGRSLAPDREALVAGGDAGRAGLLAGTVPPVDRATLDGCVNPGDESPVFGLDRVGIARVGRLFEPVEVGLDSAGHPPVFDALTLCAQDSFFL